MKEEKMEISRFPAGEAGGMMMSRHLETDLDLWPVTFRSHDTQTVWISPPPSLSGATALSPLGYGAILYYKYGFKYCKIKLHL